MSLKDHSESLPVIMVLGRKRSEQFLEGGVPILQEGWGVDLPSSIIFGTSIIIYAITE